MEENKSLLFAWNFISWLSMTAQIKDKVVPVELEMRSATKNIERQYTPTIFQAYLDKLLELAAVNVTNRTW